MEENLLQLKIPIRVVYAMMYEVLYIPSGAGFLQNVFFWWVLMDFPVPLQFLPEGKYLGISAVPFIKIDISVLAAQAKALDVI